MSDLIITLLFIVLLLISIIGVIRKNIFAPYVAFSIIWSILLFTYLISLDYFYPISDKAAFLILTGCFSFILGSFIIAHKTRIIPLPFSFRKLKTGLFLILASLTIAVFISTVIENIGYLAMGMDFNEILNKKASEDDISQGFFLTVSSMFVAIPFVYVSVPVLGLEFCSNKKRWWVVLLSLIIIVFYILQSARRSILIYILPSLLYLIISNNTQFNITKHEKKKTYMAFVIIAALIVFGVSWLSTQRNTSFKESGKEYIAGCLPSFSQRIEKCDTWYMGTGTLHGVLVPVMIGRNFFVHSYPKWWKDLDYLIEAPDDIKIGPNAHVNAFNTMFYIPYLDFGFIGVLVIPFLIGLLYGSVYRKTVCSPSPQNRAIYSILLIGLFGSMYTLYFTQYPYLLSFIYLYILFTKKIAK